MLRIGLSEKRVEAIFPPLYHQITTIQKQLNSNDAIEITKPVKVIAPWYLQIIIWGNTYPIFL